MGSGTNDKFPARTLFMPNVSGFVISLIKVLITAMTVEKKKMVSHGRS